jgi:hypothetical protein
MARPAFGGRPTCEGCKSIDVRRWHREGRLRAGHCFIASWSRNEEPAGRMVVRAVRDALYLIGSRHSEDGKAKPFFQRVPVTWTPCHLGGQRPWFLCEGVRRQHCGSRTAILYDGGGWFACRACCRLAYTSQQETPLYRSMRRARKIRARLGGSPSIFDPLPAKPSRMHRRTYQRLLAEAESADASLLTLMEVRFGPITGLGLTVRSDGGSVKMAL